jgi:hypothetical protein
MMRASRTARPSALGDVSSRDTPPDSRPRLPEVEPTASNPEPARLRNNLLGLLLVGFIGIGVPLAIIFVDVEPQPTNNTAATTPSLVSGDCVDAYLALLACDAPHFGEVIFVGSAVADAPYPTVTDPVRDWADQKCGTALLNYVGSARAASRYELRVNLPSALEWGKGDRRIICLVTNPDQSPLGAASKPASSNPPHFETRSRRPAVASDRYRGVNPVR